MDLLTIKILFLVSMVALFLALATKERFAPLLVSITSYIIRAYYMTYRVLIAILGIVVLAIPFVWYFTAETQEHLLHASIPFGLYTLYFIAHAAKKHHNPHRRYHGDEGYVNNITDKFIAWIGTIKYFTNPYTLVRDPGSYLIKGKEIRELIDEKNGLQPGDILLRGYRGYLDGALINLTGNAGDIGKYFSHAALYIGKLDQSHCKHVAKDLTVLDENGRWIPANETERKRILKSDKYFQQGKQMVIHSMTHGVFVEDILTFTRCDYLIVLRLKDDISVSEEHVKALQADKQFTQMLNRFDGLYVEDNKETCDIEKALLNYEHVSRARVVEAVKDAALGKIGACYDFQFKDIKRSHQFSCSEFVYYCYKSLRYHLGLVPVHHAFLKWLFPRETLTPEDIYIASKDREILDEFWISDELQKERDKANKAIPETEA